MAILVPSTQGVGKGWCFYPFMQGRFGPALEVIRAGLYIASKIEHGEYEVANRVVMGYLYVELLAPEKAWRHLEAALTLAEELGSRVWIHNATGTLAAVHCLLDDLVGAHDRLESVLSAETPMDTLGQRYCWAKRAELALCQGDPALALDIVERLIISAPGMAPGRVITFLWKLTGEALVALGHTEEAHALLLAAIENAHTTGERFLLWRLHASLGRLYCTIGRQPEAEKEFSNAYELIQELADTVPDGELRDNFLRRAHDRLKVSP